MRDLTTAIVEHLVALYGEADGRTTFERLQTMLEAYRPRLPRPRPRKLSEGDAVLITYGDMVRETGRPPLRSLAEFLQQHARGAVSAVHLLPFYPYSSDDGFSVIDYRAVDPALGTWEDVARVGAGFELMFDAVVNHISTESDWFQAFLRDEPPYRQYFVTVEAGTDLSPVFRPRTLPLLTPVQTASGEKLVWTTFSHDQIDLNFQNPAVLLEVLEVLLFYVARGAACIRLDAIGFLWKEIGTRCIHLEQTHRLIRLMRAVMELVAPHVALITETNVPHADNIAYFGDGTNEAHMVYNFSLPPLVLHAFHRGDAAALSGWADTLALPSDQVTFFNFLASHDGIGVTPARGILGEQAIEAMAQRVRDLGGYVSYRANPDGSPSAYELNVSYLDALGRPGQPDEPADLIARRFLAAQAIMLALRGVPGIYFHSLFGSRNWREGVAESGRYRTINRQKLERGRLERELADSESLRHQVFYPFQRLLRARRRPGFSPYGAQEVLFCHPAVFCLWRAGPGGRDPLLCLHNVSAGRQRVTLDPRELPERPGALVDLLSGRRYRPSGGALELSLEPYQVAWLEATAGGAADE